MQWKLMSKVDADQITASWQVMNKESFAQMIQEWPSRIPDHLNEEYRNLRVAVMDRYNVVRTEADKDKYLLDLKFGISLYEILEQYDFSPRMASNDQVWIYLCVQVFPDIVHFRYPGSDSKSEAGTIHKNVNVDRFWRKQRRIYLKILWWYVYLSMQKDETGADDLQATYDILKDNSTDEIAQIVERSGSAGYRVEVYRELMRFYSENRIKYNNEFFRKVMVLNTARTRVVEPALMEGGVSEYVRGLFEYFEGK